MELVFHRDGKNGNGTSPPQSASGVEDFGYGLRGDPASRKARIREAPSGRSADVRLAVEAVPAPGRRFRRHEADLVPGVKRAHASPRRAR